MTSQTHRSVAAASDPLARGATLLASVALACVLAYWTWVWIAPRPEPRVPAVETARNGAAAAGLFGAVRRDSRIAAPTGAAMKLLGVAAGSGKARGYAVVQVGGRDIVAIREGADIVSGIRLAEVHRDRIIIERNGVREKLEWPQSGTTAAPATQNLPAGIAASTAPAAVSSTNGPAASPAVLGRAPTKAERDRLSD